MIKKNIRNWVFAVTSIFLLIAVVSCQSQQSSPVIPPGVKPGYVSNSTCDFLLEIRDKNGQKYVVKSKNKKAKLPPGKFTIEYIRLKKKDSNGKNWSISSSGFLAIPLEIKEEKTTAKKFGEPLTVLIKKTGDTLEYQLKGNAGEFYSKITVDHKIVSAPNFSIMSPRGKVIKTGKFRYG